MSEDIQRGDQPMPFSPAVGCLISFLLAAIPVCLILGAAALVVRGEFPIRMGPVQEQRIWIVREGPEQGLGFSRMKKISGAEEDGRVCYRTAVSFLLWESLQIERQATYCDCYQRTQAGWQADGDCP